MTVSIGSNLVEKCCDIVTAQAMQNTLKNKG